MKFVGIQTQVRRNNTRTILLLIAFPVLLVALTWLFFFIIFSFSNNEEFARSEIISITTSSFLNAIPIVIGACLIWFLIAYFTNTKMIEASTGSHSLERKENKRIYNLVENLCLSQGMSMPKINVIEDGSLNAFASGINDKTYTVTLTRGIINQLNDEELEGVIAHELTHIKNRDVRLLIVSIVFVGIFSFLAEIAVRSLRFSGGGSSNNNNKNNGRIIIILAVIVLAIIGYFVSLMLRFTISRKREYMADAGAAEMTRRPQALASALRKISKNSDVSTAKGEEVAQLFIEHKTKSAFAGLFATHPPIEKRIEILEQFA